MCETMNLIMQDALKDNLSLRMAAYTRAIRRVYLQYKEQGITM